MKSKIGFIGTGLMGFPMAKNILKAGYNLKAFNRSKNKAEPLKEFGGEIAHSIKDVVKDSDILITMLTEVPLPIFFERISEFLFFIRIF